eukprot:366227-Chlamydomonas_euryale.AAC.3
MLCGGMRVAMPTAIPLLPLTSSIGIFDGRTVGSSCGRERRRCAAGVEEGGVKLVWRSLKV